MEDKKKFLLKAKTLFKNLKTDSKFSEEEIDNRLLKKLKRSKYDKDSLLLKLIGSVEELDNEEKVPTRFQQVNLI